MTSLSTHSISTFRLSGLAVLVAVASSGALAQEEGWYGGFNLGESQAEFKTDEIVRDLQANGFTTTSINDEDDDVAAKIFAGYSFNRYFGVEGSYYNLGEFGLRADATPLTTVFGETTIQGLGLDLVGTMPFASGFAAFARAGIHSAWVEEDFRGQPVPGGNFSDEDNDIDYKYGVGLQYDVSDAFSIRGEIERYHLQDPRILEDDVDMVSLGFVFRFGSAPPPPPPPAPAPAPQPAAQPAPPPPPPPPPEPVVVTLEADALFDFDSAEMRNEGRQDVDVLMEELRGLEYEVINITGHTDRIGARDYNLDLSQRRADTVRDYMIGSGIPAGDVTANGINGDDPMTSLEQCPQGMPTNELIECLQPDRRVEVEVSATRDPE